jgi:hypothetical protein
MHIGFRSVLVATLLAAHSWLLAAPLLEGQAVPSLAVKDQHDQAWQIKPDTILLIYSANREASSKLQAILAQQNKDFGSGKISNVSQIFYFERKLIPK